MFVPEILYMENLNISWVRKIIGHSFTKIVYETKFFDIVSIHTLFNSVSKPDFGFFNVQILIQQVM